MTETNRHAPPIAATDVPPPNRSWVGFYPEQFRLDVSRITARRLGDAFGLKNFGINMVTLQPGGVSAQRHWHAAQDEFVYLLEGELVLRTDAGETTMRAGDCVGFRANVADGHCLENRGSAPATYLAVGDRAAPEKVEYSDVDLLLEVGPEVPRGFRFTRKDGTPY